MKKGVVLSVNKFSITLLTPEGEFEKCRRLQRRYEIGEEITYQPEESVWKSFFSLSGKKAAVISAAVACLMMFSVVIPNLSTEVSAYMTIDVNPSIELGVDDDLKVIELRGINTDGERVISTISEWENKDLAVVAEQIVHKTEELGYFKDSNRKIIVSNTVIDDDQKFEKQLNQEIKGFTNDIPVNTEVKLIRATEKDRNQAEQKGISTGQFLEQQHEKEKRKQKKAHINKKNDHQSPNQEKKDSNKEQAEKRKNSSEQKKASKQQHPVTETKEKMNGNVKNYPGNKDQSKNRGNSENKEKKRNQVKSENKGNKGKSEAKSNQESKKEKSGNNTNAKNKGKGNSENKGKSEDNGNSGNNSNAGNKGNSGNNGNSGDKGNSGNNGNSEDKGNSGNNGKGNSGNNGNAQ